MIDRKNLTVLIIEDESTLLELMDDEFRYFGYKTITAICGNDAIKILSSQTVDIVVSDYKMPNGNGMSVLTYVQSMTEKRPAFYFISGQANVSTGEALKAGAKKFFPKPYGLDGLIIEIEKDLIADKKMALKG